MRRHLSSGVGRIVFRSHRREEHLVGGDAEGETEGAVAVIGEEPVDARSQLSSRRDQNSLVMSAEYRWEASWMLDAAVFVDAGKVAATRGDLNLRDLATSYGVGLRVHSNSAFVARLDLAFSREGFIPLLRFEHVF